MSSSEKRNLRSTAVVDTSAPTDLPPSYEHTVLPNSNPWTDSPSSQSRLPQRTSSTPLSVPSQNPLSALSRLSTVSLARYRIRDSKLSEDQTVTTTTNPELTSSCAHSPSTSQQQQRSLLKFIRDQACLPPKPIMVIRGTHVHGNTVVDFDLKLNLTSMLDLDWGGGGTETGWSGPGPVKVKRYQHGSSNGSPKQMTREEMNMSPLQLWVKKFCEDKAENRSFTLHRSTPNLPTALLEGYARNLLATVKYRGKLHVEFPVQYSDVVIQRKSSNWFTNMLRLYPTKKYEVVEVDWPVIGTAADRDSQGDADEIAASASTATPSSPTSSRPAYQRRATDDGTGTAHAEPASSASSTSSSSNPTSSDPTGLPSLIAQEWWREWQLAIRNAVLSGRKGWVTVEDWMEAKMGMREKERAKEWGVDHE
ncbi:uncharacterized protein Z520_03547 [Fonsecaea multimorphosa CBS 102226]|uniref:Uncharacterized protein n=1 Tax=Fonsecaea multimorphosa CBS 102226 TaxID=1442371 RepID=A0A0D2HG85_9EURO|nr:uncharacterized protein Z520_03547 [Fonsecaea multimorphosa CBS 102226]KIY00881.1 hypothetical protein Z520_03547 [Fonsecaea multimorphosa CBS 102226]OAL27707.1 hypothetical protein AYO22_03373 [Fonsecaea multimorphosa]